MVSNKANPLPQRHRVYRKGLQQLVFLLIWPSVNLLISAAVMFDFGIFNLQAIGFAALKLWMVFGLAFLIIYLLEKYFTKLTRADCFWCQLIVHAVVILGIGAFFSPIFEPPFERELPTSFIMPRIMVILEIIIYLIVLRLLSQQETAFTSSLALQETELNMLRSQSNPHFLFNTLNLITSEISADPDNAKEIVFDLADLLRSNIKMVQKRFTTVAEEMKLVNLYLAIQQKRFKDRLSFHIDLDPDTKQLKMPALLLQPVVENTVKYAVAPYAAKAHIAVVTQVKQNKLYICFKDTGPAFDDTQIIEGNGFRILRETLALHYRDDYKLELRSTADGGELKLRLPIDPVGINDE